MGKTNQLLTAVEVAVTVARSSTAMKNQVNFNNRVILENKIIFKWSVANDGAKLQENKR